MKEPLPNVLHTEKGFKPLLCAMGPTGMFSHNCPLVIDLQYRHQIKRLVH